MSATVAHADARDLLPRLGSESIDCIVTDPPYRTISGGNVIGKNGPGIYGRPTGMLSQNNGKGGFDHNDVEPEEYAADLYRVLRSPGHLWLFTNELNRRRFEDAMLAVGFRTHFLGAWVKNTVTPNRWGMKNGEPLFLFRKGPARSLYTPSLKQFIHHPNVRGKSHPTEKPVALMHDLVTASSLPGQLVLDPFCGTGSTGVACRMAGRRFIGIESDERYVSVARERVK